MSSPEKKFIIIITIGLFTLFSSLIVKNNEYLTYIFIITSWYFLFTSYRKIRPKKWLAKLFLVHLGMTFVLYSVWNKNKIVDDYGITISFLLNILIMFPLCLFHRKEKLWRDIFKIIVLLYLLFTFKFENFKMKRGKFINVDKKWLLIHLFVLLFIYQDNVCMPNQNMSFVKPAVLVSLYPLLFPLDEFLIHRVVSLSISSLIHWNNKNLLT